VTWIVTVLVPAAVLAGVGLVLPVALVALAWRVWRRRR